MEAKACNVAVSPEALDALRAHSAKTGIKIKVLVDKAIRAMFPVRRAK